MKNCDVTAGVHFPSLNSLLSRKVLVAERAFSVSFAMSGTHMGSVHVCFCFTIWTSSDNPFCGNIVSKLQR